MSELDGFKVGDRVLYDNRVARSTRKTWPGTIESLTIGVHGHYAKIVPDQGYLVYVVKPTSAIEHAEAR
jgi:hypothetical protein